VLAALIAGVLATLAAGVLAESVPRLTDPPPCFNMSRGDLLSSHLSRGLL